MLVRVFYFVYLAHDNEINIRVYYEYTFACKYVFICQELYKLNKILLYFKENKKKCFIKLPKMNPVSLK